MTFTGQPVADTLLWLMVLGFTAVFGLLVAELFIGKW